MRTEKTMIIDTNFGLEAHRIPTAHYLLDSEAPIIIIEFRVQVLKALIRTMGLSHLK